MKTQIAIDQLTDETGALRRGFNNVPPRGRPKGRGALKAVTTILAALLALVTPLLVSAQTTESFTFTTNRLVPQGDFSGLSDVRTINSAVGTISSLKVRLKITGQFNGDLYAYVRNSSGFTVLLNRVGVTTSNAFGYADSGFNVTFQDGATNGDIHLYHNITTPSNGLPLTGVWQPDGRSADPRIVTDLSPRTTFLTNFNGLNAKDTWTLYIADIESGATNMLTEWGLDISGAASPTLSWPNPADITYGTALGPAQLDATATYNSTNVAGTFTYSIIAGTVLNAGSNQVLSVTFTPNDKSGFLPVTTNVVINVLPAPLVITASDQTKIYGAPLPALTVIYSGFVLGDTVASLSSPETLTTTATAASKVGSYPISGSGASASNYVITQVNGTLTVTPAPLTITASDQSKAYGAPLPALSASYAGLVNGDTPDSLTTAVKLSTTATASSPVGAYSISAGDASDPDYAITLINGTLTVTPAVLTITATSLSKVYGAALPTLAATYSGFVLGQTATVLSVAPRLSTTATASSPVGSYNITVSDADALNYTFKEVSGTLTITPAALTITASDQSKIYGEPVPTLTASYSGFVNGDTPDSLSAPESLSTTATASSPVGAYIISASGAVDPNYLITQVNGTLTVTRSFTTGGLTSYPNPAAPGANVTFTMSINAVSPGAGAPDGPVRFIIDGGLAGTGAVSNGVATFMTSTLAHGEHTVVAEYAGSPDFYGTTNSLVGGQSINTPPLAGNLTIYRNPLTGTKVQIATLLTNDSDAEGDTLTATFSTVSASNAVITVTNGWVIYTPPAGFTNTDHFTYTVTDGHGGSATGTITVDIQVNNKQSQNLVITEVGEGQFLLNGSGIPGLTYGLQYSDSSAPFVWKDFVGVSLTADSAGEFNYTDTTTAPQRFYRTVYP